MAAYDLIIKGGRNYLPSVIEDIVSELAGVRSGCVVAVGIPSERRATEDIYVVAETRAAPEEHRGLRVLIHETLERSAISADELLLVPPGALPRTSSGKPQRSKTAEMIRSGAPFEV